MVIDELCRDLNVSSLKQKFHAEFFETNLQGNKLYLLKPMTYMNKSGLSVGEAVKFYKVAPENIFVFYDELDLPPSKVRVRFGGGHGGHNGIRDIERVIGKNFWRVRMGVGHPGHKDRVHSYILSNFSKEDEKWLDFTISKVVDQIPTLLEDTEKRGAAQFMNKLAE